MAAPTKRTTIYLDADLHKALRLKSFSISRSLSEIVNDAVRELVSEDADDLEAFEKRGKEPLISYEQMVKRLKSDGRL